jgi:hypothetical protein
MKICLVAAGMMFTFASCNSSKSTEEKKQATANDTVAAAPLDSGNHSTRRDTAANEPDLGGIGELSLGLNHIKVTEQLGQPDSKSKAGEWGADGLIHQDWFYKTKGITLNMESNKNLAEQTIFSITITSPCIYKTKNNIGIGNTYKEVMTAYEKDIDKSASDKTSITVGSIYGGIIFDFKNDKVGKIFIGAGAE